MLRRLRARGVTALMVLGLFPAPAGSQFISTQRAPAGGDAEPTSVSRLDPVRRWNLVLLAANALDHTPVAAGESRTFGEQIGPGRTARAFAIVQIAVSDALNAIFRRYATYTDVPVVVGRTSWEAAVATAAHHTLSAMYPSQSSTFDALLLADLRSLSDPWAVRNGAMLGQQVAAKILALRTGDGSEREEPEIGVDFFVSDQPGIWRPDPISQGRIALGAYWGKVSPFVAPVDKAGRGRPARVDERRVCGSVQRSANAWRRRHRDAHTSEPRPDHCRDLLGLRRHSGPWNAAATVQPDRAAHRGSAGLGRGGSRAAAGARERCDVRYLGRVLGRSTTIRCGGRSPVFAKPTRARDRPDLVMATLIRSATESSRRWARRPATVAGRTSRRRSRRTRRGMPHSAARRSRSCGASMGPTTFHSRSYPTSSTASRATTSVWCGRGSYAGSRPCRRPKKRMDRAASTWGSTGRSTRRAASRRDVASRTTSTRTPFSSAHRRREP